MNNNFKTEDAILDKLDKMDKKMDSIIIGSIRKSDEDFIDYKGMWHMFSFSKETVRRHLKEGLFKVYKMKGKQGKALFNVGEVRNAIKNAEVKGVENDNNQR